MLDLDELHVAGVQLAVVALRVGLQLGLDADLVQRLLQRLGGRLLRRPLGAVGDVGAEAVGLATLLQLVLGLGRVAGRVRPRRCTGRSPGSRGSSSASCWSRCRHRWDRRRRAGSPPCPRRTATALRQWMLSSGATSLFSAVNQVRACSAESACFFRSGSPLIVARVVGEHAVTGDGDVEVTGLQALVDVLGVDVQADLDLVRQRLAPVAGSVFGSYWSLRTSVKRLPSSLVWNLYGPVETDLLLVLRAGVLRPG